MDGEDGGLGVVRAGEHDLELELFELATQAGHAVGDLGDRGCRRRRLPGRAPAGHRGRRPGVASSPTRAHGAGQVGALANQLLGAAVVVPEGGRGHLGVERGEALSPCRAGQRCLRSSSSRRASSATSRFSSPSMGCLRAATPIDAADTASDSHATQSPSAREQRLALAERHAVAEHARARRGSGGERSGRSAR